jgi:hypothetical protein
MTAPVAQGVVSREKTKLVIIPAPNEPTTRLDGLPDGLTGFEQVNKALSTTDTKTSRHSILDEFDPDAFLSAALELGERFDQADGDLDTPFVNGLGRDDSDFGSISASSGSLTPRPFRSSPVADGELWEKEQAESLQAADDKKAIAVDDIAGVSGVRFNAVVLQTPPAWRTQAATGVKNAKVILDSDGFMPDEETLCWLSVSDLARSGIFANDFVGLVVPADQVVTAYS